MRNHAQVNGIQSDMRSQPMRYKHFKNTNIAYIAISVLLISIFSAASADASEFDSSIIKEALSGIVCDKNIQVMVEGAYYQGTSERRKILNAALFAGPEPEMRLRSLFHFGMLAHTVNSFYTNTSYLPDKIKKIKKKYGSVDDPYGLDLVDWTESGKNSKYKWLTKEKRKELFEQTLDNTTVLKVARGLAIREIQRQWDYLESLIRISYSDKADLIIAALKSASCDGLVPEELDGLPLHARDADKVIDFNGSD